VFYYGFRQGRELSWPVAPHKCADGQHRTFVIRPTRGNPGGRPAVDSAGLFSEFSALRIAVLMFVPAAMFGAACVLAGIALTCRPQFGFRLARGFGTASAFSLFAISFFLHAASCVTMR
jgi:hypothetical protein